MPQHDAHADDGFAASRLSANGLTALPRTLQKSGVDGALYTQEKPNGALAFHSVWRSPTRGLEPTAF